LSDDKHFDPIKCIKGLVMSLILIETLVMRHCCIVHQFYLSCYKYCNWRVQFNVIWQRSNRKITSNCDICIAIL